MHTEYGNKTTTTEYTCSNMSIFSLPLKRAQSYHTVVSFSIIHKGALLPSTLTRLAVANTHSATIGKSGIGTAGPPYRRI